MVNHASDEEIRPEEHPDEGPALTSGTGFWPVRTTNQPRFRQQVKGALSDSLAPLHSVTGSQFRLGPVYVPALSSESCE